MRFSKQVFFTIFLILLQKSFVLCQLSIVFTSKNESEEKNIKIYLYTCDTSMIIKDIKMNNCNISIDETFDSIKESCPGRVEIESASGSYKQFDIILSNEKSIIDIDEMNQIFEETSEINVYLDAVKTRSMDSIMNSIIYLKKISKHRNYFSYLVSTAFNNKMINITQFNILNNELGNSCWSDKIK
jgi:hypothetical protein